jgi:hypothetical protein
MPAQRKYPEELRERAVKMVFEVRDRDGKGRGEITVAPTSIGRSLYVSAGSWPICVEGSCAICQRWLRRRIMLGCRRMAYVLLMGPRYLSCGCLARCS